MLIGAPALGLSLAATTLNAFVPVLAQEMTKSRFVMGCLVSGDGLVALLLPIWVGAASDRVESRLGPRLPFLVATAPIAAVGLLLAPFAKTIPLLVVAVTLWYLAYFTYYAPYRALESDLVPREQAGRVNGVQGLLRSIGMGGALIGGTLLFHAWRPLPYVIAAAVLVLTTAIAVVGLRKKAAKTRPIKPTESAGASVWRLIRDHAPIRRFIAANILWQIAENGLRAFIILYVTEGLHKSAGMAALAMGIVGVGAVIAAPIAGKLADHHGPARVMRVMLIVFGVGLWLATFTTSTGVLLALLPVVGAGGAMALTLPYALLMHVMPKESHGASAGLFDLTSGGGALLGPLLTGAAIDLLRPVFPSTNGYAAMWPVLGTATLLSLFFLRAPKERSATEPALTCQSAS